MSQLMPGPSFCNCHGLSWPLLKSPLMITSGIAVVVLAMLDRLVLVVVKVMLVVREIVLDNGVAVVVEV